MDKFYIKNLNRELLIIRNDYRDFDVMNRIDLIETIIMLKEEEMKLRKELEILKSNKDNGCTRN